MLQKTRIQKQSNLTTHKSKEGSKIKSNLNSCAKPKNIFMLLRERKGRNGTGYLAFIGIFVKSGFLHNA